MHGGKGGGGGGGGGGGRPQSLSIQDLSCYKVDSVLELCTRMLLLAKT